MQSSAASSLVCLAALLCGCGAVTRDEAREALDEIELSSQAQALTSGAVEIGTDFTIGEGVQSTGDEQRDFIAAELPCAEIALSPGQLDIEYGVKPGGCSYRGQRYRGQHIINVSRNDADQVIIDHVWNDLANDTVRVDGTATVTFSRADQARHIVHEAEWTRIRDGRRGEGSGDRFQRPLGSGWALGFGVEGEREWRGPAGRWELDMTGVEMRWQDPLPQVGRYTLDTPYGETLSATFARTSSTRIPRLRRASTRFSPSRTACLCSSHGAVPRASECR